MDEIAFLEVWMNGVKVGRIALTSDSLCAFQYDSAYLSGGISISPFDLPLQQDLRAAQGRKFL